MPPRAFLLAVVALGLNWPACAQPANTALRADIQLRPGVERAEAEALVATLRAAQQGVRDGTAFSHLLAGAPASYEINRSAPGDSFLALDWTHVRFVEAINTGNHYTRANRPSVMAEGLGRLYWDVRVHVSAGGRSDWVEMFYGPPAPF